MKNTLYILGAMLALASCRQNTQTNEVKTDTIPNTVTQNNSPKALAGQLNGLWISDSYLNNIERSKSIFANRDYDTQMLGFTLVGDSLATGQANIWGFSEHEGGIYWAVKYNPATNRFDFDESRKEEYQDPGMFSLYPMGNNKLEIAYTQPAKKEHYRLMKGNAKNLGNLEHEFNRILFEGSYIDSLTGKGVTFTQKGTVSGLPGWNYYSPVFDYVAGPAEFDLVIFSKQEKLDNTESYHFKIKGNTLYLHPVIYNDDDFESTINPTPAFVLKKKS